MINLMIPEYIIGGFDAKMIVLINKSFMRSVGALDKESNA
jgi:hypothetical protein